MLGVIHSLVPASRVSHIGHRYIALPVEELITSGKTVMKMSSAIDAEPDPMLQKCAVSQQNQSQVILFVYIVVVLTTSWVGVITNLTDNREEPRSTPRDLRDQRPKKTYIRMSQPQVSHHQARFNEGLNK